MALVETEALVLRTYDLSDADRIVVFLAEKEGLVRGVAKGAKRPKSRFGSGLEPFTIVRVSYFQKEERELVSIRDLEIEKSYFNSAVDPEFLKAFAYVADLLQAFAPPHDPNERLYKMTLVCLDRAASAYSLQGLIAYFEIWLLKLGGYLPGWQRCAACASELSDVSGMALDVDFSLNCGQCKGRDAREKIGKGVRELYELAQRSSPERFLESAAGRSSEIEGLSSILRKMISRVLNKEISGPGVSAGV